MQLLVNNLSTTITHPDQNFVAWILLLSSLSSGQKVCGCTVGKGRFKNLRTPKKSDCTGRFTFYRK